MLVVQISSDSSQIVLKQFYSEIKEVGVLCVYKHNLDLFTKSSSTNILILIENRGLSSYRLRDCGIEVQL